MKSKAKIVSLNSETLTESCDNIKRPVMDNLFDVVNSKLFGPLASTDRRANYELLMYLYSLFCEGEARPFIPREEVVSGMASYIRMHQFDELYDDENTDIEAKTAREKANLKIKQFKRAGFLVEDTTDGFETNFSLEGSAILLLERMKEVAHKGKGQMEYTGYVYVVFTMCKEMNADNFSKSYSTLQQIEERTRALMNGLQGLNSKIRRYIENLMNSPDLTPKEIYQIVLVEYQHDVLFTLFDNIKSKDNPDRYSDVILQTMRSMADSYIPNIRQNMMETTHDDDYSSDHIAAIDAKLMDMITYVIHSFSYMQSLLDYIDRNNNRYLNSAKGKLNFILNENVDVEGRIISALASLKGVPEEYDFESLVGIRRSVNIDDKSTYAPRFLKDKLTSIGLVEPELTEEEIELGRLAIFAEDRFSRHKVDERALEILGDRDSIALSEMEIRDFDDLLFAFLMQVYAESAGLHYEIEPNNEIIHVLHYRMHNFTLYRKES